jgi:hypothetical protein
LKFAADNPLNHFQRNSENISRLRPEKETKSREIPAAFYLLVTYYLARLLIGQTYRAEPADALFRG